MFKTLSMLEGDKSAMFITNVIDCECTNYIIPEKSMFKKLSMLEGDKHAMFKPILRSS